MEIGWSMFDTPFEKGYCLLTLNKLNFFSYGISTFFFSDDFSKYFHESIMKLSGTSKIIILTNKKPFLEKV